MVIKTPTQLKAKTRNLSRQSGLNAQEIQQMYFFERIIERIARSEYAGNFVLKGGLLVSALNGIASRTTTDMDTTIRGLPMSPDEFTRVLNKILQTPTDDHCEFTIEKIEGIRPNSEYQDFRAYIGVKFGTMKTTLKMDITTGDAITPREMAFYYPSMFTDQRFLILAYPLETILAEKYETLCSRGATTTRARDFYDIYMLYQLHKDQIDWGTLPSAVLATAKNRGSEATLPLYKDTFQSILTSATLRNEIWPNYCRENRYVDPSTFDRALETALLIGQKLGFEPERKPTLDDELRRFNELRQTRLSEKVRTHQQAKSSPNRELEH